MLLLRGGGEPCGDFSKRALAAATDLGRPIDLADAGARTGRMRLVHCVDFSAERRVISRAARLAWVQMLGTSTVSPGA